MPDTSSSSAPPADAASTSFLNEDLSKPENRINVALFGAQAIPAFWEQ